MMSLSLPFITLQFLSINLVDRSFLLVVKSKYLKVFFEELQVFPSTHLLFGRPRPLVVAVMPDDVEFDEEKHVGGTMGSHGDRFCLGSLKTIRFVMAKKWVMDMVKSRLFTSNWEISSLEFGFPRFFFPRPKKLSLMNPVYRLWWRYISRHVAYGVSPHYLKIFFSSADSSLQGNSRLYQFLILSIFVYCCCSMCCHHCRHSLLVFTSLLLRPFVDRKFKLLWLVVSPYVVFTWMLRPPALCSGWEQVTGRGQEFIHIGVKKQDEDMCS